MRELIGLTVHALNEPSPLLIVAYLGMNVHGSHMFLCELKSGARRRYAGDNLYQLCYTGGSAPGEPIV